MNTNNMSLLRQIMELQFTAIELNLFLDTHPSDEAALRDMARVSERLIALIEEYDSKCAKLLPILPDADEKCWRWAQEPWPWEIVY
ncbi:MAG: spore coat protein CotJB [Desulfocucumaceae bacterium]